MKKTKTAFLLLMLVISLCAVTAQPAQSQTVGAIYILSDGTVESAVNATVPIQQDDNVYTFTDNFLVTAFVVQRSHVTIDGAGFVLSGQGERGIDLSYASNVTIKNVQLAGMFFYGIYISGTSYHTITGCTIANNGNGITLLDTTYNEITDNVITDNDIGLDLMGSSGNLFRNNQLDNTHNIAVYGTQPSHYVNDMDDSNTIGDGKKVYYFVDKDNFIITPDVYPDVGFIALVSCNNVTVYGITLTKNGHGIVLASTTDATIAECEITYNYVGILLFASSANVIGENMITENNRGIQLSMFSGSNNIFSNTIIDNRGGLFLYNSSQNLINGNNITSNDNYGVGFSASSYNVIRGNFFSGNGKHVIDASTEDSTVTPSLNTWHLSYPVGGNYWSDYTGVDVKSGSAQNETGGDQIGDTPYTIYANNKDAYPLMPFGSSPVVNITSPKNITYSAASVTLSYTVTEETAWVGYSLDGETNVTITGDTTLSGLSQGMHSVTVYAEDTDGLQGASETIYFTIVSGAGSGEPFPAWILAIIIVAVLAVILFFFVRILRKK